MNKMQLSEHIGNIDDRLVEQAEQIPNYGKKHRQKRIKCLIEAAAVFLLMAGSFSAGTFAFAREVVVEVPVEQETLALEEINLTLVLPDDWKGKYSVVKYGEDRQNFVVYNTQVREAVGDGGDLFDGGVLFYIVCYDGAMTPEQLTENGYDAAPCRYLFSTSDKTYVFYEASDVQWNPEYPEQEEEYLRMAAQMQDIKFVVDSVLAD